MADDVVHGQEIRLIAQLGDQLELMFDQRPHFWRLSFGPTPTAAPFGQRAQIACRSLAGRNELVWILVAELRQRKIHALEYRERLAQQLRRISPNELVDGPQAALGIRMQLETKLIERHLASNRSQRVLQHAALAAVHVDVTCCNERHRELTAENTRLVQPAPIVARVM